MALPTFGINDSDQLLIPTNGAVYFAPYGTALPANESAAPDSAFKPVGWIGDSAPKLHFGKTTTDIKAWQRRSPIARRTKDLDIGVNFDMLELDHNSLTLGFGGATITEPTTDHYKIVPAITPTEFSVLLDMTDGTYVWRFVFVRGTVTEPFDMDTARDDAVKLPVGYRILELDSGADPFYVLTDAAQMDSAVAAS